MSTPEHTIRRMVALYGRERTRQFVDALALSVDEAADILGCLPSEADAFRAELFQLRPEVQAVLDGPRLEIAPSPYLDVDESRRNRPVRWEHQVVPGGGRIPDLHVVYQYSPDGTRWPMGRGDTETEAWADARDLIGSLPAINQTSEPDEVRGMEVACG